MKKLDLKSFYSKLATLSFGILNTSRSVILSYLLWVFSSRWRQTRQAIDYIVGGTVNAGKIYETENQSTDEIRPNVSLSPNAILLPCKIAKRPAVKIGRGITIDYR